MQALSYELVDDIARVRLGPGHGLENGVQLIKDAIMRAKGAGIGKLLVDVTAIEIGPPTVAQRHWLMTEWATAGRGAVRFALVIRPEFIDPQHFGTMVARNHGLAFRGFTDEAQAMRWLYDHYDAP